MQGGQPPCNHVVVPPHLPRQVDARPDLGLHGGQLPDSFQVEEHRLQRTGRLWVRSAHETHGAKQGEQLANSRMDKGRACSKVLTASVTRVTMELKRDLVLPNCPSPSPGDDGVSSGMIGGGSVTLGEERTAWMGGRADFSTTSSCCCCCCSGEAGG